MFPKYTLYVFVFGFFSGAINFLHALNLNIFAFANFGAVIYCLAIAYALFKHNFLGIEIIYKNSLIYSLLLAILTGIYFALIYILEFILRKISGYSSTFVGLLAAFIIATLFNPARNKIQNIIDKTFFGQTTEEIAQENELLKQELERAERLKTASTLALGLAHEIRNPLTTIKTFAEYLPEKYKDEDFVNKFAKLIPSEVERINSIIRQLLEFSRPAPPSYLKTNIYQLINEVLNFLNSEFLKKHIEVERFDEDPSLSAEVDPSQIKQALLNIILNAIEAMPKGGVLTVRSEASGDKYLRIYVSDTGCGIQKEYLKQIFDPFFTNKDAGTGLGLAITHQIIKNHNGTIEVESKTGKGATFIIKLPLERSEG